MTVVDTASSTAAPAAGDEVVGLRNICKSFGGRPVLSDINLSIRAGETVCLIGPSGSGKSTLLRCIDGLEAPDSGTIELQGQTLPRAGRSLDEVRARIGMVFQQYNLFPHHTAAANVAFGLIHVKKMKRSEAAEVARGCLADVGLAGRGASYPQQMSGGEQQRVAIDRALAMDPAILLCDEVTSALDPELVKGVMELLAGLGRRGRTMLLATHEMRFAQQSAERVVFLEAGRIVEVGSPKQIFEKPQTDRLKAFLAQML